MQTSLTHSSRSSVDPQDLQAAAEVTLMGFSSSNQYKKIREFLDRTPNIAIHRVHDIRLYNLLHLACLNGQTELCRYYFDYLERQGVPEEQIQEWVNAGTDEGFTALHFASFKGSISLVRMLVEERKADLNIRNHKGSNVVHLAAQGDQPVSIAYFKSRGMNIYEKDVNGSTALHWATYFGMENATYFLTSWGCNPNEKDQEFGCTPLHLAISSGNSKVVRRLLVKGADKRIRNNEGKLPLDLAIENDYPSIIELLQEKNWLMTYLNVTPDITKKRTRSSLFLFQFMLVTLITANILIIFPYVSNVIWVIGWAVLVPITIIPFFFAWLRDPGYMKSKNPDILDLLIKHPPHVICPDCSIVKPDRSKHCELCNRCVALYDHHCPWINNCVGARNYGWFIMFILCVLFTMVFLMLFTGFHVLDDEVQEIYVKKLFNVDDQYVIKLIVCIVNVFLGMIFIIPLIGLNYVQMGNLVRGKTTGERFGFQGGRDAISKSSNLLSSQSIDPEGPPRSVVRRETNAGNHEKKKKWYTNCIDMCCRNSGNHKYQLVHQEER